MRIDTHVHISPQNLPAPPVPAGLPRPPSLTAGAILGMLDRYAIDGAVLSPMAMGLNAGGGAQAAKLARMINDELAETVRSHSTRFAGLTVLPLPDVDAAVAEVAHGLDVLELDGVLLMTNYQGTYAGDESWEPLYAELDRREAYVFLHPTLPACGMPLEHPPWLYEFTFDTTRVLANLIYNGIFERFPRIRWQVAHCGGATPFLAERIASLAVREPQLARKAPAGALAYLSRLYYDTGLSNNEIAYRTTRLVAPADRIVFGTDWPNLPLPEDGDDPAPGLAFLDEETRSALDANAAALVPRLAALIAAST
ncbi:amidohydrolase family protein [Streptomyces sp. NPDC058683]|uniref:amidohydrolase family protein n=1 Tax=Streptomyces sp. NPDC058683 TaxID=3346597 RepID=UPI00364B5F4A